MRRHPKNIIKKHSKGQVDHIDAWLISYADMITLLFIVVVIAIPVSMSKNNAQDQPRGEPEHPYYTSDHTGLLSVNSTFDEAYRSVTGVIISNNEDENVSVEKNDRGMWLDISVPFIFEKGSADVHEEQLPFLKSIISNIKANMPANSIIEVEGYTDDKPLEESTFANNWELSSMQTARIAGLLIDGGIDSARLRVTSHAGNSPIVPNADPSGKPIIKNRVRNQRILIKVEVAPIEKEPFSF